MFTKIGPVEAVTFGTSTREQREAWTIRHWADRDEYAARIRREAGASGSIAEAYAAGWLNANADRLTVEQRDAGVHLSWEFGAEFEHASWLYRSERVHYCAGYGNAWDVFLTRRGFTVPYPGGDFVN